MTKLNYSVEDASEDSPIDRYMGRKLAWSREAEVERDARRIAARPGLGAESDLSCALPPAIIQRWAGGEAGSAARRAKASLDCT